jgi:hypothetical protein
MTMLKALAEGWVNPVLVYAYDGKYDLSLHRMWGLSGRVFTMLVQICWQLLELNPLMSKWWLEYASGIKKFTFSNETVCLVAQLWRNFL